MHSRVYTVLFTRFKGKLAGSGAANIGGRESQASTNAPYTGHVRLLFFLPFLDAFFSISS